MFFSLGIQLWKNEGLDLKLIPYGCMATSHNSGFIEVVKNANTIAEVSGRSRRRTMCSMNEQENNDCRCRE